MYENWFRSFHAVARHGGFTAAARAVNLSQPTVTEQVKALEATFDVELFHRRGRQVLLTDTGDALYRVTRNVFGHAEEALRLLEGARGSVVGRFRIGAANPYSVMDLVRDFLAIRPDIDPRVTIDDRGAILAALDDFAIDVAVMGRRPPDRGYHVERGRRYRIDVMVPVDHGWAKRRHISIKDLTGVPIILREPESTTRQALERAARKARVPLTIAMEIDNREAMREAVALGLGIAMVAQNETLPSERLRAVRVADADMSVGFNVVCLASRRERPLIADFMAVGRNATQAALGSD